MGAQDIRDPLLCNGATLRKASRRVSQLYDVALAPSGMRCSQHSILVHVERLASPSMSELAHFLVLDRTALTRNLKPLERDGLIMLVPDEQDRRSRRVQLTKGGQVKLAECQVLWLVAQARFESVFGKEKADALRIALGEIFSDAFLENLEKFEQA